MGNRCVITTEENYEKGGVGVYLHWNGGRDSVNAFLTYCKLKGYSSPEKDCYGWARLCQVIGNFFGGKLSIGIDYWDAHCFNPGDNGVYIIQNWEIVGRKDFTGQEQNEYDLEGMLDEIDCRMPAREQLGEEFLSAEPISLADIKVGDTIVYIDYEGCAVRGVVEGFESGTVCGRNFDNVPYMLSQGLKGYLSADRDYRKIK